MTNYEILGVSDNATLPEIKKAYKYLCKQYHPDVFSGDPAFADKMMKQINEAYAELMKDESNNSTQSTDRSSQSSRSRDKKNSRKLVDNPIDALLDNFDEWYEFGVKEYNIVHKMPKYYS